MSLWLNFPVDSAVNKHRKMLSEFEKKVAGFIKENELFSSIDKILLAVSGGADSIALLYAIWVLKAENILSAELFCAHINHQLRATEADLDEDFVIAQAAKLSLPVMTKRIDVRGFARVNKLSIETAARKLRIESLIDIAKTNNCSRISTGHQKNDNAETILHRLARGTGFRGLGGIWPVRVFDSNIRFVRPLLCVTRDEIIEYLEQRNIKWRIDHTNFDCSYRRNYMRHRLLPALQQQCNSSIVEQLFNLSQSAQRFYSSVCRRSEYVWFKSVNCTDDKVILNLKTFLLETPYVKVELVRRSLANLGSGERDLTQQHYERILQLAEQNVGGKKIELPGRFVVQREYGNLVFARVSVAVPATAKQVELKIPGVTKFGSYSIEATILDARRSMLDTRRKTKSRIEKRESRIQFVERFGLEKVKLPLVVRFRQAGDKFLPLGLPAEKKLGKFLTAAKVPHEVRSKILIVTDREKIIWVWPIRISEQARITSDTRRILQLQIE